MLHWRCLCFVLAHLGRVWGKLPVFYWFDAKQKLGKLHHADELRNDTIQMVALHICIIFVIFHKLCCIFVKMRSIIPDNPSFRYILHGKTLVTQFNFFYKPNKFLSWFELLFQNTKSHLCSNLSSYFMISSNNTRELCKLCKYLYYATLFIKIYCFNWN